MTRPAHDRHMLEALVCPVTQRPLEYDAEKQELISPTARLALGLPSAAASSPGEASEKKMIEDTTLD